jgi:hypothetical protein
MTGVATADAVALPTMLDYPADVPARRPLSPGEATTTDAYAGGIDFLLRIVNNASV